MISPGELLSLAADPLASETLGLSAVPLLVVDARRFPPAELASSEREAVGALLRSVRAVTVALTDAPPRGAAAELVARFDVVLAPADDLGAGVPTADTDAALAALAAAVGAHPLAAVACAQLLRLRLWDDAAAGLVAESLTYSMLQAGPEFAAWLARRPARPASGAPDEGPRVRTRRDGPVLEVVLSRPQRHNAYDHHMRDALVEALRLAAADATIEGVLLRGDGPSFCSGGDLAEFGTSADPATAHHVRLSRSAAYWMDRVGPRVRATVHGHCIGAGVELAAYAGTVVADRDATFQLPEVAMGLMPGAGGTVSVPRRIGPWRTAWLALTGTTVDATTARSWGLVDRVVQASSPAGTAPAR